MTKPRWAPSPDQITTIKDMAADGHSGAAIAKTMKISQPTMAKWLRENGVKLHWVQRNNGTQIAIAPKPSNEWVSPAKRFK
jgi:DNA invertase Pin-like site-specific DNA recombinase